MEKLTLNVPAINCMHCVHTITTELNELEGVNKINANAETKEVIVEYETPATEVKIRELLAEINYPATA